MGQDPSDIRAQIEETRERVGNEVDALSYKTDVPARVGDYVGEKKQAVASKLSDTKEAIAGTASGALPDGRSVGRLKDTAERNPLGLAAGGVALGLIAGLLVPSSRIENERLGQASDRVIDAAKETASDALESGKRVAREAAESAKGESQELASSLQERAQDSLAGTQEQSRTDY